MFQDNSAGGGVIISVKLQHLRVKAAAEQAVVRRDLMKWHMAIEKDQWDMASQTRIEGKRVSDLQKDGGISGAIGCSSIDGQAEIQGIEVSGSHVQRIS